MNKIPLSKEEAVKIAKSFVKDILLNESWYQKIEKGVFAIVLYGSVAKGTNRPDSDIDLLVILPVQLEKKFTQGEYFFKYESFEINIVLRSIEKLRRINFKKNIFQKEVFRDSEFILENNPEVRLILQKF